MLNSPVILHSRRLNQAPEGEKVPYSAVDIERFLSGTSSKYVFPFPNSRVGMAQPSQ